MVVSRTYLNVLSSGIGIESLVTSVAYAAWTARYAFIVYFVFGLNKAFLKGRVYNHEGLILVSISAG